MVLSPNGKTAARYAKLCLWGCAAFLCALLPLMLFTGHIPWKGNSYNSYTLQALAWLNGRLDIADGPMRTWLELAILDEKYYVSFPPFPSVVLLPFAAFMGENTPDGWIALAFALLSVCLALRICVDLGLDDRSSLYWTLFLTVGNGVLFISLNGWVWYIAQIMCFALSLGAICAALRGRGVWSLTMLACATGCRPMALFWLPVVIWLLVRHWEQKPARALGHLLLCAVPAILIGCGYMVLNQLRFGSPFEFGHNWLPEFSTQGGVQFSFTHLPNNLWELIRLPEWDEKTHAVRFSHFGSGMCWALNPLLLLGALAWWHGRGAWHTAEWPMWYAIPICAAVHLTVILCHRTLGGWQFGNRYLLDMLPWLFFVLIRWGGRSRRLMNASVPLFVFGAAMNWIGTVLICRGWL